MPLRSVTPAGGIASRTLAAVDDSGSTRMPAPTPSYPPGITVETLARGMPRALDGQGLVLLHVTYEPGAVIRAHTDPGAATYSVQSGTIELSIESGTAQLERAGQDESQMLNAGDTIATRTGDAVFYDAGTAHTTRNSGRSPATMIVAAIFTPDKPLLQPVDGDGAD